MCYKNGKDILPAELLVELQKYIQGELIYIPKEGNKRKAWGESNGTRASLQKRNYEIYKLYKSGVKVQQLVETYNLSEDSIRKILLKINSEKPKKKVIKISS